MIEGLSHLTFSVKDTSRTAKFLKSIFDAEEVYSRPATRYFLVAGVWIAVIEGNSPQKKSDSHIAFKIPESEFDGYIERLNLLDVEILESRKRTSGEGRSIYFYDYDNHLFEIHTGTLEKRLEYYRRGSCHDHRGEQDRT